MRTYNRALFGVCPSYCLVAALAACLSLTGPIRAEESTGASSKEKKTLSTLLFPKKSETAPAQETETKGGLGEVLKKLTGVQKESETVVASAPAAVDTAQSVEANPNSAPPVESLYPEVAAPETRKSVSELEIEEDLDRIGAALLERVAEISDPELQLSRVKEGPAIPAGFEATWSDKIRTRFWTEQKPAPRALDETYILALTNSFQVKSFADAPLIQETAIVAAEGQFDPETFANAQLSHDDEPTGSVLTTGSTGRFVGTEAEGEIGVRKQLRTGTSVSLSNRLNSLDTNSEFLDPNPQTGSDIVLRVVQPLLRGNGYHYNMVAFKIAKLDSKMAAADYIANLENHLLDVNRSYWAVYLARAAYVQREAVLAESRDVLKILESREKIDAEATVSELLRVKSEIKQREADLIRTKVAIRNADERLRSLVNDPDLRMGAAGEFLPISRPVLSPPVRDIQAVAHQAVRNRPEVLRGLYAARSAGVRRDLAKKDLLPQLNLIGEAGYAGLDGGRDIGGAFNDLTDHGTEYLVGLSFNRPWSNRFARSIYQRRQLEVDQSVNLLNNTVNAVLLEALVAYREVITSYQDMQAKYQAVEASREEVRQLRDRLDLDANDGNRSVGYQLQLILDAIDRNQVAEEEFLVSVVAYNISIAAVERAQGTLLQYQNVQILRDEAESWKQTDALRVESRKQD